MKVKKLKNLIKKTQNALEWQTVERPEEISSVRILSDQHSKTHTILLPLDPKTAVDEFSYLHELGHATLCEQIDPVFAANSYFASATSQEQFIMIAPALQTASDWYVSYWLMEICPEDFKASLQEKLELVEKILVSQQTPTVDVFLEAAQTVALGIRYLRAPIDCGDMLKDAVDSFLSVDANKPARNDLTRLVNRLMSIYTLMRAQLTEEDDGVDVWEICPSTGTTEIGSA